MPRFIACWDRVQKCPQDCLENDQFCNIDYKLASIIASFGHYFKRGC